MLSRVPQGGGRALDLGGGAGELARPITERGYEYVNVDLAASGPGAVKGDAHALPFADGAFALVVSSDSLEHFQTPSVALKEVHRVLRSGGRFVLWVPFMHPFHGDDYYRYTPLGLRHLLEDAELVVESIETPLGLMTLLSTGLIVVIGLGARRVMGLVRRVAGWLDSRLRILTTIESFSPFYLVVATKPAGTLQSHGEE